MAEKERIEIELVAHMKTEKQIQNEIRLALSETCVIFRINVGVFKTADGRVVSTGVPNGFSDLFGYRRSDGRAVFIEVKKPGGAVRPAQTKFLKAMRKNGALTGIARSVEDAKEIVR